MTVEFRMTCKRILEALLFLILTQLFRDIVDVKHINTDVEGMIMGPLTRWNDDKASEAT
jgi:hypothetical protein